MKEKIAVRFYPDADDEKIRFVVILCRKEGKWLLVKHRQRNTYAFPGGHREAGETSDAAANRELTEETGASSYRIERLCAYSVTGRTPVNESGEESFGMLYYAEVEKDGEIVSEIECSRLFDVFPEKELLTYPDIQPKFIEYINGRGAP